MDGRWLFGAEPTDPAEPVPPVELDTGGLDLEPEGEADVGRAGARSGRGPPRKGDGIRKTYFVLVMNEDYRKRGWGNLYANKTRSDVRQYLRNELKTPDTQIVDVFDSLASTNDTVGGTKVYRAITSLTNQVDAGRQCGRVV